MVDLYMYIAISYYLLFVYLILYTLNFSLIIQ